MDAHIPRRLGEANCINHLFRALEQIEGNCNALPPWDIEIVPIRETWLKRKGKYGLQS